MNKMVWLYKIKMFLCKFLRIRTRHYLTPFIYVEDDKQVEMSAVIRWLDRKTMLACSAEEAENKWNKYLVEKYGYNDEWIYYL